MSILDCIAAGAAIAMVLVVIRVSVHLLRMLVRLIKDPAPTVEPGRCTCCGHLNKPTDWICRKCLAEAEEAL